MLTCLGLACGNAARALRIYRERFQKARHPADSRLITAAFQRVLENRPIAPVATGAGRGKVASFIKRHDEIHITLIMGSDHKQDIQYIQEWMQKEAHLPEPFKDKMVLRFLHSTYYSLEQTKKCIERFCNSRHYMPHVYTKRDPLSASMKTVNSLDDAAFYICEDTIIFFYKVGEDVDRFIMTDAMKGISNKLDAWLEIDSRLSAADAFVFDLTYVTMKHVTKTNPFLFRDFILYMLESLPARMKKIFLINAPPVTDIFFNMAKPVLPAELIKIINISPNYKPLHDFVDKKFLPSDYGGEAPSVKIFSEQLTERISNQLREMFLDDNLWKGEATKIPRKANDIDMKGSFRSLDID